MAHTRLDEMIRAHARLLPRVLVGVASGRLPLPIESVELGLARLLPGVRVEAAPPGVRISGGTVAMGTPLRFSLRLTLPRSHVSAGRRELSLDLDEVSLSTTDEAEGPLAEAVRGGMIDLTRPADLIGNQLGLPAVIARAEGKTLTIDLLRLAALRRRGLGRALASVLTAAVFVDGMSVRGSDLVLHFRPLPGGARALRAAVVRDSLVPALERLG